MKRRILALALALTIVLTAGFYISEPAVALDSTRMEYGKNNLHWERNRAYAVNDSNELWEFIFPYQPSQAYNNANPSTIQTPIAASSKKIMDGVREIMTMSGGVFVLKTNGVIGCYAFHDGFYTDYNITNAATLAASQHVGGLGGSYISNDGSLYGFNCEIRDLNTSIGHLYAGTPELIDVNVRDAVFQNYIKNDGTMWKWSKDSGEYIKEKLLDDVKTIVSQRDYNRFAITNDGSLWAWGFSNMGETGVSPSSPEYMISVVSGLAAGDWHLVRSPVKVLDNIARVIPDRNCTHAVTTSGKVLTWGGGDPRDNPEVLTPVEKPENQWMASGPFSLGTTSLSPAISYKVIQQQNGTLDIQQIASGIYEFPPVNGNYNNGYDFDAGITFLVGTYTDYTFTVNMSLLGVNATAAPPTTPAAPSVAATPTASIVQVNGENVVFDAYNINGNNYFKLRDLAFVLSGTEAQFEVGWDGASNAIILTSGQPYTQLGGEMQSRGTGNRTATVTRSRIYLDGLEVQFSAYNIDGNNYFKLRDIGATFDFGVVWDGARNTIVIDTNIGYTPE